MLRKIKEEKREIPPHPLPTECNGGASTAGAVSRKDTLEPQNALPSLTLHLLVSKTLLLFRLGFCPSHHPWGSVLSTLLHFPSKGPSPVWCWPRANGSFLPPEIPILPSITRRVHLSSGFLIAFLEVPCRHWDIKE